MARRRLGRDVGAHPRSSALAARRRAALTGKVCLLSGGFGGARFAPGLVAALGAGAVSVVTNPGDDVRLLGGEVWPDFDAVLYALAGLYDEERGWGIRGEGFVAADAAGAWFRVGDRDLALSRERAAWLDAGVGRAEVARRLRERLGVEAVVVPAAAEPMKTQVLAAEGDGGWLELQEWLVRRRAEPVPRGLRVVPAAPRATAEAVAAIRAADLVLLGPSSPLMSLLPLLGVPEVAAAVSVAPRLVAVSPTVSAAEPRTAAEGGRYRVRGLLLTAHGVRHSATGIARLWGDALDGFVLDGLDAGEAAGIAVPTSCVDLLARGPGERSAQAAAVAAFGLSLPARPAHARPRLLPGLAAAAP